MVWRGPRASRGGKDLLFAGRGGQGRSPGLRPGTTDRAAALSLPGAAVAVEGRLRWDRRRVRPAGLRQYAWDRSDEGGNGDGATVRRRGNGRGLGVRHGRRDPVGWGKRRPAGAGRCPRG